LKTALWFLALAGMASASTPSVWEMSSFADFMKGKFEGVSVGRDGRLAVAPKLDAFFNSSQPVIWAVATGPDGSIYAATGHGGKVFRLDKTGAPRLLWNADRPEVFALAVDPKGVVYAASSPDGKIYRIENGQASEYFDPKCKYIWALTLGLDGALYAGTSDNGKVFRITGAGKGEEYYVTGQGNVTSLLADGQGRLLAGTEPNGILYRITAKNKAFALYDSSLPEIRAISQNADGSVYAVGLGGALAKKVQAGQQAAQPAQTDGGTAVTSVTVTAEAGAEIKPAPVETPKPAAVPATTTGSAALVDLSGVEKSAIYRVNADNTVDTLWSSKEENVFDVLPTADGHLYFGTDQNGRVYQLSKDHKLTLVAQTNEAEVVRMLRVNGALLAATANMGKIYRLGEQASQGSYESPVFDAGGAARWGKLRWQGSGSVTITTRTGNSIRPDATWSEWSVSDPSTTLRDGAGRQIVSPNARYLQFTAVLSGKSAALDNISAAYLPQNNPPVVRSVTVLMQPAASTAGSNKAASTNTASAATVPFSVTVTDTGDAAPVTSTGTPTQTLSRALAQQLAISWQADDPDGDRLVYQLDFRGEGEREWKVLRKGLRENTFNIDGDALADGRYFFRVTASDREANPAGSARDADLVSAPVLIDNTPPVVRVQTSTRNGKVADVAFEARDETSVLKRAEWSLDAGPWTPLAPVDGILDSPFEQFRLHLDDVPDGEHVLVLRCADSGNNSGLAKVILH
jgi:hypothetical protein